ncbi:hypothetical protein CP973_23950 [Streptomyces albofaciens JCM 4342]|nr:hypothetical protein CP973_23950 [Streptomyces albofaciens JCM 4342]
MVAPRHAETALEAVDLIRTYSMGRKEPPVRAGAGRNTVQGRLALLAAAVAVMGFVATRAFRAYRESV